MNDLNFPTTKIEIVCQITIAPQGFLFHKMSRDELQAFLIRYADGLLEKDGKSIDLREVEKDLRQIKGISDKRVEEIMAVFEKHLGV